MPTEVRTSVEGRTSHSQTFEEQVCLEENLQDISDVLNEGSKSSSWNGPSNKRQRLSGAGAGHPANPSTGQGSDHSCQDALVHKLIGTLVSEPSGAERRSNRSGQSLQPSIRRSLAQHPEEMSTEVPSRASSNGIQSCVQSIFQQASMQDIGSTLSQEAEECSASECAETRRKSIMGSGPSLRCSSVHITQTDSVRESSGMARRSSVAPAQNLRDASGVSVSESSAADAKSRQKYAQGSCVPAGEKAGRASAGQSSSVKKRGRKRKWAGDDVEKFLEQDFHHELVGKRIK